VTASSLYRGLTTVAGPLIGLYLRRRLAAGKEDPARFAERFGHAGAARPPGPLVWLHGASVGEAVSALPLIERLTGKPGVEVLLTTGTVTSARLMAERLPPRARHQYAPVDRPDAVARFLDHWRPDLGLWIESEFWPNLLAASRARGTPCVLVNARISARSFARWRRLPGLIGPLLRGFSLCLAPDSRQAECLRALGADAVRVVGNLKSAAATLPADDQALAVLRAEIGDRPLWLAASTHPGEEAIAAGVHRALAATRPDLLTVIVPRHPERGAEIKALLDERGLTSARRSRGAPIDPAIQVYIADTMGELGVFYRLAPVTFVGGSLVAHGGQNPLEPARLGSAVVVGPRTHNFADFIAAFAAADALREVADETHLAATVAGLLDDPAAARRLGAAGRAVALAEARVLDRVEAELAPFIDPLVTAEASRARA